MGDQGNDAGDQALEDRRELDREREFYEDDGPPGVPHYPDPTEPFPDPETSDLPEETASAEAIAAHILAGTVNGLVFGRATALAGALAAHRCRPTVDRDEESLRGRIVQALLLPEDAPSPSGLPSWQTNDREDAEAIAATVVRALFLETDGGGS